MTSVISGQGNMEKYIKIQLTKCQIFLTEAEITSLLARDTTLWTEALKRGKAFTRARTARERESKIQGNKEVRYGQSGIP